MRTRVGFIPVILVILFFQVQAWARQSAPFSIPDERGTGRKDAPIMIEVFSDFQCTGCGELYLQTLANVIEEYCKLGKVYLLHREYPLSIHRYAREAARWALACAGVGRYEEASAALFRDQAIWEKSGDIESTIASTLSPTELATVKQALKNEGDKIDAALDRDLSIGRAFPVHGTPSFRILLYGTEIFADHDEPEKILPTDPKLKSYAALKRYLDEKLSK
jgi:protein-disulfide isomerase